MFGTKYKINFSYDEKRIIVYSLVELKNKLIAEGRYTDAIDDLLIKYINIKQLFYSDSYLIYWSDESDHCFHICREYNSIIRDK